MSYRIYRKDQLGLKKIGNVNELKDISHLISQNQQESIASRYIIVEHDSALDCDHVLGVISGSDTLESWQEKRTNNKKMQKKLK